MIRVNLLPEEYRPTERTSWSVLLAFIGVIFVVAGAGFFALWIRIEAGTLADDLKRKNGEEKALQKVSLEHEQLKGELDEATNRERNIKEIARSKINWAKKLDELTDLILKDEMWIHELELVEGTGRGPSEGAPKDFGSLRISCFFVGESPKLVNAFYQEVRKSHSFYSIFRDVDSPQMNMENISTVYNEEFEEEQEDNLASTLTLLLQGPEEIQTEPNETKQQP